MKVKKKQEIYITNKEIMEALKNHFDIPEGNIIKVDIKKQAQIYRMDQELIPDLFWTLKLTIEQ